MHFSLGGWKWRQSERTSSGNQEWRKRAPWWWLHARLLVLGGRLIVTAAFPNVDLVVIGMIVSAVVSFSQEFPRKYSRYKIFLYETVKYAVRGPFCIVPMLRLKAGKDTKINSSNSRCTYINSFAFQKSMPNGHLNQWILLQLGAKRKNTRV